MGCAAGMIASVQPNANWENLHSLRLPCFSSCPHIHELLLILKLSVQTLPIWTYFLALLPWLILIP